MVAHSTLTGSDLHEPKGVASATSGQIYVANGSGSGVWRNLIRGHLYYDNIGTGVTLTAPTAYTLIGPSTTAGSLAGFSHNSTGRLTSTSSLSEVVTYHATITFKHSSGTNVDVFFQMFKNGSGITGGQAVSRASSSIYSTIALSGQVSLASGDYLEMYVKSASGNVVIHSLNIVANGRP